MRRRKPKTLWPSWRYSPDGAEGRPFARAEDVPAGWITHEERAALAQAAPDEITRLRAALSAKGVPFHHKAGVKRLTELLSETDA